MENAKQIRNSFLVSVCMILAVAPVAARTFRAALPPIRSPAFYRIALPPHASAVAGPGLQSLRLLDNAGREQPYFIGTSQAGRAQLGDALISVPVAAFSQTDSNDKRSYIRIRFDEAYPLDRLRLQFAGPRFYSRIVRMPDALPQWQRSIRQNQELVVDATLREHELLLLIENDDNPPLRLSSVHAEQRARYLTAWLEPGAYRLRYDDTAATPPRYDITVLADSLSRISLPLLTPGTPQLQAAASGAPAVQADPAPNERDDSPHSRAVLLWCIIGVILVALVFATRALARRIGSERNQE